ncbi:Ger(x)C family spore germination protein [Neobacillus bataviensis]|uniref:Ger(x)C family spore germination protein n=1 Tax=Neobacillus bataviensis TaxID=220685 RepID=UPI001CBAB22B|nr:Ger(x)C family spore germination protein [Neobacillus bataviensis]
MKKLTLSFLILLVLSGCWDQQNFKDLQMIDMIGFDKAEKEEQMKLSLAISSLYEAHQGGGKPAMEVTTAQGSSLADAIENTDFKTPGQLTFNQTRLYIMSKSFASDKPIEKMKVLGQVSTCPLTSNVVMYDGKVSELLARKKLKGKTMANYLTILLESTEVTNYMPKETLLRFIFEKNDPYVDVALPLIQSRGDNIQLNGSALFREGSYSGVDLSPTLTKIAQLMKGVARPGIHLIVEMDGSPYDVLIKKASRKIVVNSKDNKVSEIMLPLKIQAQLLYSQTSKKALTQTKLNNLEKMLTEEINKQALQAIQTLQKANCDYLGFAREIHAYYHKEWSHMNWRKEYPRLPIRPEVKLQILNSGVML